MEWRNKNTKQYAFRISLSTGIPDAIKSASEKHEVTEYAYIRLAIEEKLRRDGYLEDSNAENQS